MLYIRYNINDNTVNYTELLDGSIPISTSTKGLKICHLNIRGLPSKIEQLRLMLALKPFHVICLNETFCDTCIDDDDVQLKDFNIDRNDRNRHGGGVAIYVSSSIPHKVREDLIDG